MFIYPYRKGSKSVAALKEATGAKVIKLEGSNFKGNENKVVINWGNSRPNEEVEKCIVLNSPEKVANVSNKLTFFQMVEGQCRIPEFTTDKSVAEEWSKAGKIVVVREKLCAHSGEGVVLLEDPMSFEAYNHAQCALYVRYVPKKQEYRVHIAGGEVILVQRKAKSHDYPNEAVNWKIRSHNNGFVFAKNEDHTPNDDVLEQAKLAMTAADLDFGAVDVVWNEYLQQAFVLEINTAPGLEGTTAETYIDALSRLAAIYEGIATAQDSNPFRRKRCGLNHVYWDELLQHDPVQAAVDHQQAVHDMMEMENNGF